MKLCRYDRHRIGLVRGRNVHDVSGALELLPPLRYPVPFGDQLIAHLDALREGMERLADEAVPQPVEQVRFLSPVANPSKIMGTPVNYAAHVEEARRDPQISVFHGGQQRTIEEQGLFLKASSSLVGPSEGVIVRFRDRRTDHEAELGVVIGRQTGPVSEADALGVVAGYAIALDMVVRGKEDRSFRKSPDTYAVLGPWLVTADELGDPGALDFTLHVNGELRQAANTREMIIGISRQISWASSVYTLYPGDIIMSGTCQGVAPVNPGDVMTVAFERIGEMTVPVR
ncbi:MAG TPA: fumarylacetoacetate hydrolase family protein [Xanthobacteraceae bacterium]|nr:fumarylacetoacetate hydrolase family protein [Xanthobacteraceae bacterium]